MARDGRSARSRASAGALLVCLMGAWSPGQAQDRVPTGRYDLQVNFEQSRGLYREPAATVIRSSSLVGRYRGETWVAEIQVPHLETRTRGENGGLPGTAVAGRSVERGLGDIWLKLGVELLEFNPRSTGVDLTIKVKTRTGDVHRGLGTGGTDVALQADLIRSLGPFVGFGHVGYRWTGDVSGFAPYRNPWYAELGAFRQVVPTVDVGAMLDVRNPIGRLGSLAESTIYAAWRQGGYRTQVYVTRGFAPASPQWAFGISLRTRF